MTKAKGQFEILSGGEDAYEDRGGGARLTHAWGDQRFTGDIVADGNVHWLMSYAADKTAQYVGLQRIRGSLAGREGSFMIAATGAYDGTSSHGSWSIIQGSGTGALGGITGTGSFDAPSGPKASYEIEYELP